ncbi:16S rRNA (guanine(966)-N(2))-methyltransferase RsmD [Anaerosinus massiliensis]|uniref:16S rRNA (guanine(966)-N(2))-methyltransferase RsmD n=1 Tax=Massilibacillus massiliensis TaxID=1806837 RepID=UPI000AA3B506|nr:16S rRNA (guanine(966)-N(2))-methyltransferase RsmD [Massilibacillus massiliensis]
MRIITGVAKGCKLKAPKGLLTRPTADRVKESVFNILGGRVYHANVLDLFAGTGNLGLEALSRGAEKATFIDHNINSFNVIKENAIHTKLFEMTEVFKIDVFSALHKFHTAGKTFDLIFCDPPYNKGFVGKILETLDQLSIIKNDGLVVIEHSKEDEIKAEYSNLNLIRSQKYGLTIVSFFAYEKMNIE